MELICIDVETLQKEGGNVRVPIKEMEAPAEPKELYPQENFKLKEHNEVNASSEVDLVFDPNAKTHHSKMELEPKEVIP